MATPQHKNPWLSVMKFTILVEHSLVIMFSLFVPYLGVEMKIFKEIHQIYTFYPKITSPWGWRS